MGKGEAIVNSIPLPPTRKPAVAGTFYPAAAALLRQQIHALIGAAPVEDVPGLKFAIVPHAGYAYSGLTAAKLYGALIARRHLIRRVVLLGPAHRVVLDGLAVPSARHWASSLGLLPIDPQLKAIALGFPQVQANDLPHAQEHALEVQLPFLQTVLGEISILPVAVGRATPAAVAQVVHALWGGPETLVLLSTDLSHYLAAGAAEQRDQATIRHMLAMHPVLEGQHACGASPANGLFEVARRRGIRTRLIDYRHSGQTTGDPARVVGYAAIAGIDPYAELGEVLLRAARAAIEANFGGPPLILPNLPVLQKTLATFVTLQRNGRLRGCIGSLQAHRKLLDDVLHNARAAAFADQRFSPLEPEELADVQIEVSLLSTPEAIAFSDEAEAISRLRPGIDGLILIDGEHCATYLPQVWAQLAEPASFLARLKEKAGLSATYWSPQLRLLRYTVEKWKESNHGRPTV